MIILWAQPNTLRTAPHSVGPDLQEAPEEISSSLFIPLKCRVLGKTRARQSHRELTGRWELHGCPKQTNIFIISR